MKQTVVPGDVTSLFSACQETAMAGIRHVVREEIKEQVVGSGREAT